MLGTSLNRSYRDSVKDAQPHVLRSTSFRLKELSSSVSSPPSGVPLPVISSSSPQAFPVSAKYNSLEKKGPKTKPKPQGVVITQQPPATSPHTPKERHVVSPDNGCQSPPPLPSVPPVGPPPLTRICGRKRLTTDQKKRSYSEPENMNEVGVSDPETTALFRRRGGIKTSVKLLLHWCVFHCLIYSGLPETSVAHRRKMFELASSHVGAPQSAMSRSDMRQDTDPDQSILSGESSLCSTLTPGPDLRSLQSNLFYPGRVTTPRPPAQPIPGNSQSMNNDSNRGQDQQTAEPQHQPGLSKKLNEALQRAGPVHRSGRSASAEDLLERLEKQYSPQHIRSRSSPTADKLNQTGAAHLHSYNIHTNRCQVKHGVVLAFALHLLNMSTPDLSPLLHNIHASEGLISPEASQYNESTLQPALSSQDISHPPVTHRERQRSVERLGAYSTSTLAASVGLPFPFSPAGNQQDSGAAEWEANERLSQANLDAITFSEIRQTSDGESRMNAAGGNSDRQTRHSLCDTRVSGETTKDGHRSRTFSLELTGGHSAENTKPASPVTSASPPYRKPSGSSTSSHLSVHPHLSSLRISESSLFGSFEQQQLQTSTGNLQEMLDEVFYHNSPPPPPPPPLTPPIKETNIMEDFPPPPSPPPPPTEMEAEHLSLESSNSDMMNNSIPIRKSSVQCSLPLKSQPSSSIATSTAAEDVLVFEYQPLPKREKTPEELRVEALACQLVRSSTPRSFQT
ncbi:hypothetical protein XENOCAPTIV_006928 [Xenoophorus captivus]|uniref:ASD1 domain-containing protein n=1 Tax=Xenoophorus captivus TaxID=1517983 RepID=A0ABV0RD69_9TELE